MRWTRFSKKDTPQSLKIKLNSLRSLNRKWGKKDEEERQGLIKLLDAQIELERNFKGYKAAYEDVTDKGTP